MVSRKPRGQKVAAAIDLRDFRVCGPLLDSSAAQYFGANASFCLRQHHPAGRVELRLADRDREIRLRLTLHPITEEMKRTFADLQDATEQGAYGVALVTAASQLKARFAGRSFKGTGFDFYLFAPEQSPLRDPDDIFGDKWGLEVSGILKGEHSEVQARLRKKRRQVAEAAKVHPVLVAVVEFSEPSAVFHLLQ